MRLIIEARATDVPVSPSVSAATRMAQLLNANEDNAALLSDRVQTEMQFS
jgi:hypothetical protein